MRRSFFVRFDKLMLIHPIHITRTKYESVFCSLKSVLANFAIDFSRVDFSSIISFQPLSVPDIDRSENNANNSIIGKVEDQWILTHRERTLLNVDLCQLVRVD
jgi:hypothetical protein